MSRKGSVLSVTVNLSAPLKSPINKCCCYVKATDVWKRTNASEVGIKIQLNTGYIVPLHTVHPGPMEEAKDSGRIQAYLFVHRNI